MIVPTRWATMTTVAPAISPLEGGPEQRIGLEVERREAVVEDVDLGTLDERAGDGEALALAARQVRSALGHRRLEPSVHARARRPRPGRCAGRSHSSSSVASALPKRRLLAIVPPNRNAFCGMSPMRAHTSSRRASRTSTPSIVELPGGHVVEARDEVDERGLATPRAADDGGGPARLDDQRDVAQDRILGARVAELDVTELRASRSPGGGASGVSGSPIDGSVRRTSWIRPDETIAPRDHDEHEHGHHHGEQDLHDVLQERDEVADRHLAAVHADGAEPQDRDRSTG